jgi:uncharacterized membrane protein
MVLFLLFASPITINQKPPRRPKWMYIIMGGLFIGTAYALVVRAMRELPAAHVVSFSNAGIVLVVFFSIFIFKEKENWKSRLSGALLLAWVCFC